MKKSVGQSRIGANRGDEGFTLVELLITLVIGPIVLGGLVMMLLLVFNVQNGVSNKISGSVDAEITTTNLVSDVQGSTSVSTVSVPSCGANGTQILATQSQNSTVIVSYDVVKSGTKYSLMRYQCSSSNTTTPTSEVTLSNDVASTQIANVTCTPSCNPATGWVNSANVAAVSLSVTEPTTKVSYSLTSTPRAWSPAASQSGGSPIPDITVLGTNTNNCSNSALTLGNNSGIQYGNGNQSLTWGSSCTQSSVASNSSWNNQTQNFNTWSNNYGSNSWWGQDGWGSGSGSGSSSYNDPLGGLTTPTYTTPSGNGGCNNGSCSSGNYTSSQNWSGNETFGDGTYVFTQPVTISGGNDTFGNGTYVFQGGLTVTGSSNVNLGGGTFICNGGSKSSNAVTVTGSSNVSSGSNGSLIYVGTGQSTFTTSGSVSLCGKSSNQGVSVWNNCNNGSTPCVNLNGSSSGGSSPCNYGGVYCPNGGVSCQQGKCSSAFVDCGSLQVSSGSTLCVG